MNLAILFGIFFLLGLALAHDYYPPPRKPTTKKPTPTPITAPEGASEVYCSQVTCPYEMHCEPRRPPCDGMYYPVCITNP